MFCVSVNLTSSEWMRIKQCAEKQWPKECLSRAEIVRRYALFGMESLQKLSLADQSRLADRFQASMESSDERLRH